MVSSKKNSYIEASIRIRITQYELSKTIVCVWLVSFRSDASDLSPLNQLRKASQQMYKGYHSPHPSQPPHLAMCEADNTHAEDLDMASDQLELPLSMNGSICTERQETHDEVAKSHSPFQKVGRYSKPHAHENLSATLQGSMGTNHCSLREDWLSYGACAIIVCIVSFVTIICIVWTGKRHDGYQTGPMTVSLRKIIPHTMSAMTIYNQWFSSGDESTLTVSIIDTELTLLCYPYKCCVCDRNQILTGDQCFAHLSGIPWLSLTTAWPQKWQSQQEQRKCTTMTMSQKRITEKIMTPLACPSWVPTQFVRLANALWRTRHLHRWYVHRTICTTMKFVLVLWAVQTFDLIQFAHPLAECYFRCWMKSYDMQTSYAQNNAVNFLH